MKPGVHDTYPLIRRAYDTLEELAEVINRNRITVFRRLSDKTFTQREKELIAKDLISRGIETNISETIEKYFGGDL